jgi:[ribosomal protein S5]-alanine N-acetyltransferase
MDLKLKILKEKDVGQDYVDWFLDREVIRFSNNQYRKFTIDGQKEYVKNCFLNNDIDLFGIYDGNKHIGNISISGLSSVHKKAEVTYVIGDRKYWGKGVATFALLDITKKAVNDYMLNKLVAGSVAENIASIKVLEKNGFVLEGTRPKHLIYGGKFYNQLDYGLLLSI